MVVKKTIISADNPYSLNRKIGGNGMTVKFPERLRELRKQEHISQKNLSQYLGFGPTAISSYETGRNEPCYDTLLKLARFFDISIDYLIGNADLPRPSHDLTEQEIKLLHAYRYLTESEQTLILSMIQKLAEL